MRTGCVGYACALAPRKNAGSATPPNIKPIKLRRFMAPPAGQEKNRSEYRASSKPRSITQLAISEPEANQTSERPCQDFLQHGRHQRPAAPMAMDRDRQHPHRLVLVKIIECFAIK